MCETGPFRPADHGLGGIAPSDRKLRPKCMSRAPVLRPPQLAMGFPHGAYSSILRVGWRSLGRQTLILKRLVDARVP